jgi:hypothetical protein
MKPVIKYKKIKIVAEFCAVCDDQLIQDNSQIDPYKCKCGVWKWNSKNKRYEPIKD